MSDNTVELYVAAKARFDYHEVSSDESVLIIADSGTFEPLLSAVYKAAIATAADVTVLTFKAREQPFNWEIPGMIENAIYNADFTFSLLSQSWFYNASSERVRGHMRMTGKRMTQWDGRKIAIPHFISCLPGNPEVTERSQILAKMMHEVRMIRVTSSLGTQLIMERGDPLTQLMNNREGQVNYSPLSLQSRLAIAKREHPPTHEVMNGTIMFQGAYSTFCPGPGSLEDVVREPVRIEIYRGRIVSISRDTEQGIFLDDWFRSWEDPAVYYIDHFNIGTDHRINLEHLDGISTHHNYGGLLFGFGVSFSSNRGDPGVFRANAHIELPLTGATLYFDDRLIIVDGEFTRESGMRAPNRRPGTGSAWQEVEGHVLPEPPKF